MRVLVVDDSPVLRMLLLAVLEDAGAEVRLADGGEAALALLESWTPDIVTMDLHMPGMDGVAATEQILARYALPVVILTASSEAPESSAAQALAAGALAVLDKPNGPGTPGFQACADKLVRTVRTMAEVKVVRRPAHRDRRPPRPAAVMQAVPAAATPKLVAIGASAGGPAALRTLLQHLAPQQPWPLVVAQHIAAGFIKSYCHWLTSICPLSIRIASDGETMQPNSLYLAPEGWQLGVAPDGRVRLEACRPEMLFCPSADYLFESAGRAFRQRVIAIQLSGMGRDGARGIAGLRQQGALTLVQEPATAVIDSMPRAAIELGGASEVLAPEAMAALLNTLAAQSRS